MLATFGVRVWRGKHPVFLGSRESKSSGLDRAASLLPGLDYDLVAASGKSAPQGNSRENVSRIPEGGQKNAQRLAGR
jgi:hypothetical protein